MNTTAPLGARERCVALVAAPYFGQKASPPRKSRKKRRLRAAGLRVTTQAKTTEDSELLGSESKPRTKATCSNSFTALCQVAPTKPRTSARATMSQWTVASDDTEEEPQTPRLTPDQLRKAQDDVRACYLSANPEKLASGEVEALLKKYAGQEALLLQRVRHRYGLSVISARMYKRGEVGRASQWSAVDVDLRADGCLRWAAVGSREKGSIDVREGRADAWDKRTAGRIGAFCVFGSSIEEEAKDMKLTLACSTDEDRDAWVAEVMSLRRFFKRLHRERACQAEEAKAVEEAMKVSQSTAEQDQQRHLEYERRLREEEERALQLSQEEKRTEDAERSRPQTLAGLEASLDDALRHTAEGRDHESREDWRAAHGSYKKAVAAFVQAKRAVAGMPGDQRPEDAVLELIASGTAQCKEAADACRQRGRSAALGAVPLLDAPRRHPVEELEKVVLDADDV